MNELKPTLAGNTVTPDTAVENLKGAALTDSSPSDYQDLSKDQKLIDTTPTQGSRAVASEMASDSQRAAAIAPDAQKLTWAERFGKRTGLGIRASDISRRRAAVANEVYELRKKGQQPSEKTLMELDLLREDADTVGQEINDLNVNWGTSGLAEIFVSGSDTLKDIWAQKELVAGSTAAGAGIGAAFGSVTLPVVGTFAGLTGGAVTGLGTGTLAAGFIENKNRFFGETYDELSVLQANGKPLKIDEQTKAAISTGVAYFGASLELVADRLLADRVPVLKRIFDTKRVREYATNPVVKANIDAIGRFGKEVAESGLIEGSTEVLQGFSENFGEMLARTWNGKETSFADAMTSVAKQMTSGKQAFNPSTGQAIVDAQGKPVTERGQFWGQRTEEFAVGAIAGSGFTTIGHGYSKVHDKIFSRNNTDLAQEIGAVKVEPTPVVNAGSIPADPEAPVVAPGAQSIVTNEQGIPTNLKPQQALNFALTLGVLGTATKDAKIEGSPVDAVALQKKMLEESGIREVWLSTEALNRWSNTEAKAEKTRQWLFGKYADLSLGGRVPVDAEALIEMIRQDDSILQDVRQYPDGLSFAEAKEMMNQQREATQATLEQAGAGRATDAPDINQPLTAELGMGSTDEDVISTLGTKQEAYAYMQRLAEESARIESEYQQQQALPRKRAEKTISENQRTDSLTAEEVDQILKESRPELIQQRDDLNKAIEENQGQPFIQRDLRSNLETLNAELRRTAIELEYQQRKSLVDQEFEKINSASNEYSARQDALRDMRARVNTLIDTLPDQEQTPQTVRGDLTPEDEAALSDQPFMSRPRQDDLVRAGVASETIKELATEHDRIRDQYAKAVSEISQKNMDKVLDVAGEIADVEDAISTVEQGSTDPNIEVVENFIANRKAYQINPKLLNPAQRARFGSDGVLEHRKVFNDNSQLGPDDLARLLAVDSGDAALEILATVPDRKTADKNTKRVQERDIDEKTVASVEINSAQMIKLIEEKQKLNVRELNELVKSPQVTARQGVEADIASRVNLTDIAVEAKTQIEATRLSQLNPKQYEMTSKMARRRAEIAASRGDFMEAVRQREIEIKADELMKQTYIALGKSNKMIKRMARRLRASATESTLREGGGINAFNEFNKIVNMDPNGPDAKAGAFAKWAAKIEKEKHLEAKIPDELIQDFDPRSTPQDLSYNQLSFIFNEQSKIIEQSRSSAEFNDGQAQIAKEQIEDFVEEMAKSNPDFNEKNLEPGHESISTTKEKAANAITGLDNTIKNINYQVLDIVRGDRNHPFYQMVYAQLAGTGVFNNGYGQTATTELRKKIRDRFMQKGKAYGNKRINKLGRELIMPTEFNGSTGILSSQGTMTKLDLLMMLGYYGSAEGRNRLKNFNINPDSVLTAVEKHLTKEDALYLQEAVHDTYTLLRKPAERMKKELTGEQIEFVEGLSYTVHGIKMKGGYVPLKYRTNVTVAQAAISADRETKIATGEIRDSDLIDTSAVDGFTKQGQFIERVKNFNGILSLDFKSVIVGGFEDTITASTMAVPIQNVMAILNNTKNAKNIAAVIGKDRLDMLRANVLSTGKSIFSERVAIVKDIEESLKGTAQYAGNVLAKNTLMFVPSTWAVQLTSLAYVWSDLGVKGSARYAWTAAKLLTQPWRIPSVLKVVSELDSSIGEYANNIDEYNRGGISDIIPENKTGSRLVRYLKNFDEVATAVSLKGVLGSTDLAMKLPAVVTYYNRFIEQNADLEGKKPQEIAALAQTNLIGRTRGIMTSGAQLERSFAQKSNFLKQWVPFFNDVRNIYNYSLHRVYHSTRYSIQDARKAKADGKYGEMAGHIFGAGGNLLMYQFTAAAALSVMTASRGLENENEEELTFLTAEWEAQFFKEMALNFINPLTVGKSALEAAPIIRDIAFNLVVRDETDGNFISMIAPLYIRGINNIAGGLASLKALAIHGGDLTAKEEKELLQGMGSVIPGFPYRAIEKYRKSEPDAGEYLTDIVRDPGMMVTPVLIAVGLMGKLLGYNNEAYEVARNVKMEVDPNSSYEIQAIANGDMAPITPYEARVIQYTESGGDDTAQASTTSAGGRYQFVKKTWDRLATRYPEAGLTTSGRLNSVAQQETAFNLLTRENAITLLRNKLPVNLETIYMMHHFKPSLALAVLKADDKASIDKLGVSLSEERAGNAWIDGGVSWVNNGRKVKTVGQFKNGLADLLDRGESKSDEALDREMARNP